MREMRRADRLLSNEDALTILQNGEYGILATVDKTGRPYGVPLSYALAQGRIYYHSTSAGGSKQDHILDNPKVSFTIVGKTKVLPDKFGALFESVIVFGEASQVTDEEEKAMAFRGFLNKYCAGFLPEGEKYMASAGPKTIVVRIDIKSMTGKRRA